MNLEQAYCEQRFEIRFPRAKGNEFQTLFEHLLGLANKADFMACRPWGKQGECKNDGFLKSERTLSQVYAPNEMQAIKAIAKDIPLKAYDYIVNGNPALEWVMERQAVTTDKGIGIVNDANLWATEPWATPSIPWNSSNASFTVSLKTMKIVNRLPSLGISAEPVADRGTVTFVGVKHDRITEAK